MKKFLYSYYLPVVKFMFPTIIIGALLAIYPGIKSYQYVWKNNSFCLKCHNHDYVMSNLSTSVAHKNTNCTDCHGNNLHGFFNQAFGGMKKNSNTKVSIVHLPKIKAEKCFKCHSINNMGPLHKKHLVAFTKYIAQNKIDLLNLESELLKRSSNSRNISCGDCHGGVTNRVHSFSSKGESCLRCHNGAHKGSLISQKYGCKTCHYQDFL